MKRVNNRKIEALLKINDDQTMTYEDAIKQGWVPLLTLAERKPINGYGYARFELPFPKSHDSVIYPIIEELFKHVGPANMKIVREDGRIHVEVRKCILLNDNRVHVL